MIKSRYDRWERYGGMCMLSLVMVLILITSCQGGSEQTTEVEGVIFKDNFDSQSDWNATNVHQGVECVPFACSSSSYPKNYNFFRSVPYESGLSPVVSIRRLPGNLPDHTTGNGKSVVIYNESHIGANWPGDGILGKYFGPQKSYPELYIRFWLRTQPGWKKTKSAALSKIFRMGHWNGTRNIFAADNHTTPMIYWDFQSWNDFDDYAPNFRCDPNDYYCADQPNAYQKGADVNTGWGLSTTPKITDGNWHRYDFNIKINSAPNVADGKYIFSLDGVTYYNKTDVIFRETGSTVTGFNYFSLGGNSNNVIATGALTVEQWYAIDDVVVSTTPIPADFAIGDAVTTVKSLKHNN